MCGIIGILSQTSREIIPEVIGSLIDLEYRGYDSAGLAVVSGDEIKTYKCIGAPSENLHKEEIYKTLGIKETHFTAGIGHNRWATHGEPSIQNAHPHKDCSGEIAIVHNGTIFNYAKLKAELLEHGHTFTSQTDTEVIAHLIEEASKEEKNLEVAIQNALAKLEGSFGVVVMSKSHPNKLFVAKNGSPINIGLTKEAFIVASSINAIYRYTEKFISLQDGEYAILDVTNGPSYRIFHLKDAKKRSIQKKINQVEGIEETDLSKGAYESFMLKEIHEQPEVLKGTLLGRFDKQKGQAVLGGLIDYKETLQEINTICTVACGTANHAAIVGGEVIEHLTNLTVRNEIASEFRYKRINLSKKRACILAVSQSGETADTLESVKEAKLKGLHTFGVVNVVGSAIAEETHAGIYTRAGAEIGVASTKAFLCQVGVFYLLALKFARERSMTLGQGKAFIEQLERLPNTVKETLKLEAEINVLANKYKTIKNINFLGRGVHFPIAKEAALKFKELTYIETGSYPLGELKHGPIAIIDEECLSVIIMPHDQHFELSKNSLEQIKSKGGKILVITDHKAALDPILEKADDVIFIPSISNPIFYPLVEIVPLQLFSYYFARALGRNVDKPRNLAKSVTVE